MKPQSIVDGFLAAFYGGDIPGILERVVTQFTMDGPFAAAHDADELIQLSRPLFSVVDGVRVQRWVVEGDNVSALYDIAVNGAAGKRWMTMGGWFTVVGDRVATGHVIYDSAKFEAILSGR